MKDAQLAPICMIAGSIGDAKPIRSDGSPRKSALKTLLRENGLSLALVLLFLASFIGQIGAGLSAYNEELSRHGQPDAALFEYLTRGHFLEATFENWESEFLQMGIFVLLTVALKQKGLLRVEAARRTRRGGGTVV